VKQGFQKTLSRWIEGARRVGFFLLLLAGSAALGILIAWPLWYFATTARNEYTIFVLALAGAAIVFLAVRGGIRRRKAARDSGVPRRSVLAVLLSVVMVVIGCAGLYAAAALFSRRLWIIGSADVAVWAALLWLMGRARAAAKSRKVRRIPAENGSE
jgi:hypothetical protein